MFFWCGAFMGANQGCVYKNGTDGTYKLQFLSAVRFLLHVVVCMMYAILPFKQISIASVLFSVHISSNHCVYCSTGDCTRTCT